MRLIDADRLTDLMQNYLKEFETMVSEHGKGLAHGTRLAIERIAEQPTIYLETLNPKWIPFTWRKTTKEDGWDPKEFPLMACGELPGNGQDILVTNGCHVWSDTFFDDDGLYLDSGNGLTEDVTAWMPLPEPYTPAEVEDRNE